MAALRGRRLCAIIRTLAVARGAAAISFFLFKRFASLLLTLVAASLVVFAVLDVLPGNVAEVMLGASATPESVAALSAKLGLDRPAPVRYLDWARGFVTGDLGTSIAYDTPVAQLIGERLVVTVPLALMAMALTTLLAFSLGLFAAARHGRAGDVGVMSASQIGIALPNFWFAILLIWLFAVKLRWFSAGYFPGWHADGGEGGVGPALRALVLPALALAVAPRASRRAACSGATCSGTRWCRCSPSWACSSPTCSPARS